MSVIDDTSPQIRYDPEDAWQSLGNLGEYGAWNWTAHSTAQASAKASFVFTGRSISVTCLLWPTGSNFTATLDGNLIGTYDTAAGSLSSLPKVFFLMDNLDDTIQHTFVVEKVANDPGWVSSQPGDESSYLYIDSVTFDIPGHSPSGSTSLSQRSSTSRSHSSSVSTPSCAAAIFVRVVGVIASIALVVAFNWHRRRLSQVVYPSTSNNPFIEAGMQFDGKIPEKVTQVMDTPLGMPSALAPVQEQAVTSLPSFSSLERDTAVAATTTTKKKPQLGEAIHNGTNSSSNPRVL